MLHRILFASLLLLVSQTRLPSIRTEGTPAPPPTPGHVLEASDLSFDGWINVPTTAFGFDNTFASGAGSGRTVGGHPHLFVSGHATGAGAPNPPTAPTFYELDVNGLTPAATLAAGPRAALYSSWPDVSHGHYQSFNAACTPSWNANNQVNPTQYFYNENNNLLYYTYVGQYSSGNPYTILAASLDTPSTSGGSSTFVGGPWKLQSTDQYNNIVRNGTRASSLTMMTDTGKMLIGGIGYFNPDKAWGPNLYRNDTWPDGSTPGGCPSSVITVAEHLLAFYPPSGVVLGTQTPTNFDPWTGAPSSQPIAQFNWPASAFTYPYQRTTSSGGERINPQTYGIASMSQSEPGFGSVGWFHGANKVGMIYSGSLDASSNGVTDDTDCTNAALEAYINFGQGYALTDSHSGTFTNGTVITGATSGARVTFGDNLLAGHDAFGWSQVSANFTVGETVTGFSSSATGTVSSQSNSGTFHTLVLTSVSGTFTVGEYVTGGTSHKQIKVSVWNAGTSTVTGDAFQVNLIPPETINAASGGTAHLIETHRSGVFDGGCACTASMSCVTGPSSSFKTPVLLIYDPADLEQVALNNTTDYTVVPHAIIELTAAPFNMTDLYYHLAVRGNGKGPRPAGGWIDTANLKMYLMFHFQALIGGSANNTAIARFTINDSPVPTPIPLWAYGAAALGLFFPKRRTIR